MTYGIFQDYYTANWTLQGSASATGIIGTTQNGVMYLSMPFLFALFARRWVRWRRSASLVGVLLACLGFLLSSFSTSATHLILTQGILAALGCALIYSPTTLTLGEWFSDSRRALAYGVVLSCKNVVGSTCPFLLRHLLDVYGFRTTLRIWTAIVAGSALLAIYLIPAPPATETNGGSSTPYRPRKLPWHFLRHRTFYIHALATTLQSSGYGIPQTYLSSYASQITTLSTNASTLLLTLFNIPGIVSSSFFGYLSDPNTHRSASPATAATTTSSSLRRLPRLSITPSSLAALAALASALSAFFLWGFTSPTPAAHASVMPLLTLFSVTFGFFAGGYSATWGGVIAELEVEARERNEALDSGVLYGLLNGARGLGYVGGGLAGLPLLKAGGETGFAGAFGAYGTEYGPLVLFTGLCSVFGGWGVVWRGWKGLTWCRSGD